MLKFLLGFFLGLIVGASTASNMRVMAQEYRSVPIVATAAPQGLPALTPQMCVASAQLYLDFMSMKAQGTKKQEIQKEVDALKATPPDQDDIVIQAILDLTFSKEHPNPEQEARAFLKSCLANKGTNI